MAVQLPNFLAAQLVKPDYSGIGDLFENYYGGKALKQNDIINESKVKEAPLDLLMKQIQAEFARPNAETALSGAKLGNAGKGLSNQHMAMQLSQLKKQIEEQNVMESMIRQAMANSQGGSGGGMQGGSGFGGQTQPMMSGKANAYEPIKMNDMGEALSKVMGNPMMQGQSVPTTAPLMNDHPAEMERVQSQRNERVQELEPGTSSLYGIDRLYEMNPLARPYLEKKGYKKEVKRETDKRAGVEKIYTKWPSGKITVKTIMPMDEEAKSEIPLTKPVLNKAVMQVRGTDAVMPYVDKLIELATPQKKAGGVVNESKLPYFYYHPTNAGADYEGILNEAADKYLTATGLNVTDQSLKTVKHILERRFGESDKNYLNRLKDLKIAKDKERIENIRMIEKGLKKYGNAEINAPASEMSDEQLKAAYNGD